MKRKILALLIAASLASAALASGVYGAEKINSSSENTMSQSVDLKQFDSDIKDLAEDYNNAYSTSVQYALYDNGQIVLSDNAGVYSRDKNNKNQIDKNTMYGVGSVSKMYVTAAVMKLVQEGKVDLDAPVTKYIKDFTMKDDRYKKITVRMLLNHSSGLMGGSLYNAILYGDNDSSAYNGFLDQLKNQKLDADPGEYSVYCNGGFCLAQILVERVSNEKFSKFLKDNFSDVLNLESTKAPDENFDREKLARVYLPNSDQELPEDTLNMTAAGGMYSTAEDLCKFSKIFMHGNGILSDDILKKMENKECLNGIWSKGTDDTIVTYGLGWDSVNFNPFNEYGIKALCKGGDTYHYHAGFVVLPDNKLSCSVLTSGSSSVTDEMLASTILLKYLKEKGSISEIKEEKGFTTSDAVTIPPEMQNYTGIYNASTLNMEVNISGNQLILSCPQIPSFKYTYNYTKDGYFTRADDGEKIKFVKEKNGKTYIESIMNTNYGDIGIEKLDEYSMQKVPENKVSDDVKNAWLKRKNKLYLLANEKYTSENYIKELFATGFTYNDAYKGYIQGHKIQDEDNLVSIAQIPCMTGRDQLDYNFYRDHSLEYAKSNQYIYVSSDSVYNLSQYLDSVTINDTGYTKYFKVPEKLDGRELTVTTPKNSSFFLYNTYGQCINASYVSKINTVKLQAGDCIAFAGDKGSVFGISIK